MTLGCYGKQYLEFSETVKKKWVRGSNSQRLLGIIFGTLGDYKKMDLLRLSSRLFRAMFAMKEIENGKEIHRRVSA